MNIRGPRRIEKSEIMVINYQFKDEQKKQLGNVKSVGILVLKYILESRTFRNSDSSAHTSR